MSVTFGMILVFVVGLLLGVEIGRAIAKDQMTKVIGQFIETAIKKAGEGKK